MNRARALVEQYGEEEPILVLGNGNEFDEALVGVCHRFGQPPIALYDRRKVIAIFAAQAKGDGDVLKVVDPEEAEDTAIEHFYSSTMGSWVGEYTPAFVEYPEEDE